MRKRDFICRSRKRWETGAVAGWALAVALLAVSVGCQAEARKAPVATDTNLLRGVVRCYAVAARDLGRPPQKMDELAAVLAPATDDPMQYLRSLRDGQEFVVVWGLELDNYSPNTILAYERTGMDGKRMVVNLNGDVTEVSSEEFEKLKFPENYKPE